MRAPGAVSGVFALECAMDELAYALKMDPVELRLVNFTDVDPDSGKPYSSKALRECYRMGAEKFGWSKRNPEPRSMRDGRFLVGWGMATGVWGAFQQPASASITFRSDGTAHVASATSDIGPGTYTVMTLIAAEFLGLSAEKVKFELGDTKFPAAPVQPGFCANSPRFHGSSAANDNPDQLFSNSFTKLCCAGISTTHLLPIFLIFAGICIASFTSRFSPILSNSVPLNVLCLSHRSMLFVVATRNSNIASPAK
jgi:CO/xanthine dehydrogenase Mo-binding subunit